MESLIDKKVARELKSQIVQADKELGDTLVTLCRIYGEDRVFKSVDALKKLWGL